MPELLEVETYRVLAEKVLGRTIAAIDAHDDWYLKGTTTVEDLTGGLVGESVTSVDRHGKLLMMSTTGADLGLRFGMTGRLLVDGRAGIDRLEYSSDRDLTAWDRFGIDFTDGGSLVIRDPRRLGGVELDPDTSRLGPDADGIDRPAVMAALEGSTTALKARILDQSRIAGLGNLLVDEILWRAGLDPARPAGGLDGSEAGDLAEAIAVSLEVLGDRGGSHTGDLQSERHVHGVCPLDGTPLERRTIGGRTTYSCPTHQR